MSVLSSAGARFRTQEEVSPAFAAQAQDYLEEHDIKRLYERITSALIISQPADPLQFMVEFLESGGEAPGGESGAGGNSAAATGSGESFTKEELVTLFTFLDRDASAGLDVGEIVKGMQAKGNPLVARARKAAAEGMGIDPNALQEDHVYDFFDSLDRDGNGLITV